MADNFQEDRGVAHEGEPERAANPMDRGAPATALGRLRSRRPLIGVAGVLFLALALVADLSWLWAVIGFLGFGAAAGLLPSEEGELRPVRGEGDEAASGERAPAGESDPQAGLDRLPQIMEAIPDPAILLEPGGAIVSYNAKAARQYRGLTSDGNISSVVRNPDFLTAMRDVGGVDTPITVSYVERVPVERRIDATLAKVAGGERQLIMACLRDLSAQERTNRMRQDFIANASHELRTPLASLIGFIETLQGPARKDAKSQKRFLNIMAKQANRMTRLIDDLLSLSRVEMKEHLPPDTIVDVNETVRHVIDMLEPLARKVEVKIRLQGDAAPARVQGDRDELIQLFQNLIQNAVKYGADGEAVQVAIERLDRGRDGGQQIAVSVSDEGAGIAPEHLPRLTERFYRIDAATSRDKGGTGLGLAIVKHIVNRHGGELQVMSEPGEGATFKVTLPLALERAAAGAAPSVPEAGADSAA